MISMVFRTRRSPSSSPRGRRVRALLGRAWGLVCTHCIYYLHGLNAILSQADLWMLYKSLSKWI